MTASRQRNGLPTRLPFQVSVENMVPAALARASLRELHVAFPAGAQQDEQAAMASLLRFLLQSHAATLESVRLDYYDRPAVSLLVAAANLRELCCPLLQVGREVKLGAVHKLRHRGEEG